MSGRPGDPAPRRRDRKRGGRPGATRRGASGLAVLAAAAALLSASCSTREQIPNAPRADRAACATILSTNDSHGYLLPTTTRWSGDREVGGAAALGGYFEEVRAGAAGCPVFLLSAGDIMQGTPISNLVDGESTIAAFNALGYDAAAIGNHEFDWTVEVLQTRIAQARFPMLGANIYIEGTDRHPAWARPYAILERRGVRVGVVGAVTRSTPTVTRPANVTGLEFRSISEALDRYIPELRARGVDFVVVLLHAGGFCDEQGACDGEAIRELQATTAPFDYAVTGHTHTHIETVIHGAPVVQSFAYTTAFGVGRLRRDSTGAVERHLVEVRTAYVDRVTPDPEIAGLVEEYRARVSPEVDRVVATLAEPLDIVPGREHVLGRLIADAQRSATSTQVALMNNGGIRRSLPAGPVTYGTLFELQPFQNALVKLDLSGSLLLAALEHALGSKGTPDAHISGLTVRYDPAAPAGGRILSASLADGTPIRPGERYTVTVNDFMATGGSGFDMFQRATSTEPTGIVDVDALADYLAALPQPVRGPADPRWLAVGGGS
ncbi:MAG: bifunctional metallophosphatase/5'-nucleotidase [Gemmatimonadota bacterium]